MEKIRYEVDPFNRLIINGRDSSLPRHRRILDGVFRIGDGNSLEYHSKTPVSDNSQAPSRIRLNGNWSLTKDHDLQFTLDTGKKNQASDSLVLAGKLLDIRHNSILFSIATRTEDGLRRTYLLELTGAWAADERNRVTFSITREFGKIDILTFDAAWDINGKNELVYRYEKRSSTRRTGSLCALIFKGRWHISDKSMLTYSIEGASNSAFDFRTGIGICSKDHLEFEVGIGLARRVRPAIRKIILYGSWKVAKGSGLVFEIQCAGGKIYSIAFCAEARISEKDTINFKLMDPAGRRDLGLQVELEHDILKGSGSAFLRLLKSKEASAILLGASFPW